MKILVGMSGGVDSSTVAVTLKLAGHEVTGIHMIFWNEPGRSNKCCNTADLNFARSIADRYGFPLLTYDYRESFREKVVKPYLDEDHAARTPNPCITCNRQVKFGKLLDIAEEMGMDKLATGHYARLVDRGGLTHLYKAVDPLKDQSYFLHQIPQEKLQKVMFPLGTITKEEVKEMASSLGLINTRRIKKESMDLCFIPDKTPEDFLRRNSVKRSFEAGDIVNSLGQVIGRHRGLPFYTLGQRRGLSIGGLAEPLYVVEKIVNSNRLVVGKRDEVKRQVLELKDVNIVSDRLGDKEYEVKIRYRGQGIVGTVFDLGEGKARVELSDPVEAITPGQFAVIYDSDRCVGGGEIERVRS